jgi:hypothetical protein
MAGQQIVPRVDVDFGYGFVDVSEDVVSEVKAAWGIHGSTPTDRCADPGTMAFDLDNSVGNSGGIAGWYAPGGPFSRPGFVIGAPVRLVLTHPLYGEKVKWVGTLQDVKLTPGVENPRASITCVDWMDEAAKAKMSGVAVQTDIQSNVLFPFLVDLIARQPPGGIRIGTGSDVYPYALDNVQDESSVVITEFQKLAMSEYGQIYVTAGTLVFEGRLSRAGSSTPRLVMDENDNLTDMTVSHSRDDINNRVQVSIHPRRRDSNTDSVLFNLGSPIQLTRGSSQQINCPYRDPAQVAQRVGGVDMQPPVHDMSFTDYILNTQQDGLGTDISSQLTVLSVPGGNSAQVTVTNAGPSDGYLVKLQLRGRGLYDFEPVFSDRRDAASLAAFGENVFTYDMPYQSSLDIASDLAQFLLNLNKDEGTRVLTATFVAQWGDKEADACFNLEITDRVQVSALSSIGQSGQFFINGFTYEVRLNGLVVITVDLAPVDRGQFWTLEVPGRTELDETTILGYGLFATGWVLQTSALATDTFLN